ncbi:uncharacterized protein LOC141850734 [Brevipalpus obovatus]|uniref:uncharacterized protein LOC141850734 n=1 Tax=Brevipalpus obovatus TaxID=246614 RepID=UPI003D9F966C
MDNEKAFSEPSDLCVNEKNSTSEVINEKHDGDCDGYNSLLTVLRQKDEEILRLQAIISEREEESESKDELIVRLKKQIVEQEDSEREHRENCNLLENTIDSLKQENLLLKDSVKDLHEALDQLAIKYDEKMKEISRREEEIRQLTEKLKIKYDSLLIAKSELYRMKELNKIMKRNISKVLENLSIGCKFFDSYIKQIRPRISSSPTRKIEDFQDTCDRIYECSSGDLEDHIDQQSSDDEDFKTILKERRDLAEPLIRELKTLLGSTNEDGEEYRSKSEGSQEQGKNFTTVPMQNNESHIPLTSSSDPANLNNEFQPTCSELGFSFAQQAAQISQRMNINPTQECFGDSSSEDES